MPAPLSLPTVRHNIRKLSEACSGVYGRASAPAASDFSYNMEKIGTRNLDHIV